MVIQALSTGVANHIHVPPHGWRRQWGGTAAPSYKGAVLENGLKIQVPPFIEAGEKIIVSTEDGSYVRRAE